MIIVGTHYDELDNRERNKYVEKMRRELKERYVATKLGGGVITPHERGLPRVLEVFEVSCKNKYNIAELRNFIYDSVLSLKGEGMARYTLPIAYFS